MKSDDILRDHLIALLKGGNAYMTFTEAVADFSTKSMNTVFPNGSYSPWALLEHIRRTQWDILDFVRNPLYQEMSWPEDYWPPKEKKASKKDWENTINRFQSDMDQLLQIVKDPKTNLYAKIPHGTGQTILREILLVADHNAYHTGEFTVLRQVMKTWPKNHKA
jgi:hypothetical protein